MCPQHDLVYCTYIIRENNNGELLLCTLIINILKKNVGFVLEIYINV